MGRFNRRFVVRGIAVAAMAISVTASMGGSAQAVRAHHFDLDPGEDVPIRTYLFGATKICAERDDPKPGDAGRVGLAVDGIPDPIPTLVVDDDRPVSCTEYKGNGRTVTATNISDIDVEVSFE